MLDRVGFFSPSFLPITAFSLEGLIFSQVITDKEEVYQSAIFEGVHLFQLFVLYFSRSLSSQNDLYASDRLLRCERSLSK